MYAKLALTGISKNYRAYVPFILAASGVIMTHYIVTFLSFGGLAVKTGETIKAVLAFGGIVLSVFSGVFLFYTNSFLIKNRKTEFGLYNILGMGKREIAKILMFETLFTYGVSIAAGLFSGILFSKLAELILLNLAGIEVNFEFKVPIAAVLITFFTFFIIFILIMLNTLRQIHFTDPINLLRSKNIGEKPPKSHYLLATAGLILLAIAYTISISIKYPLKAVGYFFLAVILVIIATYLLFIAGSVAVCKILKRNKRYYYKTAHFLSVSQMAYRMRRNGAGLASICVLSTMVLVTVSSTACLFFGVENTLRFLYPRDFLIDFRTTDAQKVDKCAELTEKILNENGVKAENVYRYNNVSEISGLLVENKIFFDAAEIYADVSELDSVVTLFVSSAREYDRIMNKNTELSKGEALIFSELGYNYETLYLSDFGEVKIKERAEEFLSVGVAERSIVPAIYLFLSDNEEAERFYKSQCKDIDGDGAIDVFRANIHNYYCFDADQKNESVRQAVYKGFHENEEISVIALVHADFADRKEYYQLFGALFFLGITLGAVFLCAAVLIMYYKQISEGYEDKSKYDILRKVGMTKTEIRKSINSQILTVFFLPLAAAGLHTAFAFPMISKLLSLFGMKNDGLYGIVCLCCFLAFAVIYAAVYILTSGSYYRIVSTEKK